MAKCKYCQTEYYTNVPRMWKHLLKCANCPGTVKETVKQKQKAGAPRLNVPDNDDERMMLKCTSLSFPVCRK